MQAKQLIQSCCMSRVWLHPLSQRLAYGLAFFCAFLLLPLKLPQRHPTKTRFTTVSSFLPLQPFHAYNRCTLTTVSTVPSFHPASLNIVRNSLLAKRLQPFQSFYRFKSLTCFPSNPHFDQCLQCFHCLHCYCISEPCFLTVECFDTKNVNKKG